MSEEMNKQTSAPSKIIPSRTPFQWLIFLISVGYASFFLYTAFHGPFVSTLQRGFHVCVGLIIWVLYDVSNPKKKEDKSIKRKIELVLDAYVFAIMLAMAIFYVSAGKSVLMPTFKMTTTLYIMAILFMLGVMEAARRTIGPAVPILSLLALAYALGGKYIPGTFGHTGFRLTRIMEILCFTDRGILGSVTGISATIIATFTIFGAILFATGGGDTFINIASLAAGNTAGGAAKMASLASGLFGMISGSSAANVATTGAFTIPMMKRMGYSNDFAAASEASASSGGQIMPPIMGAGAFIMSDLLGISYKTIALSAIIPSVLFYVGVMWGIDCYAKCYNYRGIPADQMPDKKDVMKLGKLLPVFLPIGLLICLFFMGFTPVYCAAYSVVAAVVLYLVTGLKELPKRIWNLIEGLATASKDMLSVISLIACSQILVSLISTTGVGVKFTKIIVMLGGSSLLLAGICAMVATMILGMGMPTVAAYILSGSVIAPALVMIGVDSLAAHFFVFYYAIFAGLTPPVCGTVFVAAAMADSNWLKTAWISIRLSIGAFLVPFILIFNPGMILIGSTAEIIQTSITSLFGIISLGAGFMGYMTRPLNWPIRFILIGAGLLMVAPTLTTDLIGIVIIVAMFAYLIISSKKQTAAA